MVVSYENKNYPGEVVGVKPNEVAISAMEKSGPSGWKWPSKPDILTYALGDIVKKNPPVPCGSRTTQFQFLDVQE